MSYDRRLFSSDAYSNRWSLNTIEMRASVFSSYSVLRRIFLWKFCWLLPQLYDQIRRSYTLICLPIQLITYLNMAMTEVAFFPSSKTKTKTKHLISWLPNQWPFIDLICGGMLQISHISLVSVEVFESTSA